MCRSTEVICLVVNTHIHIHISQRFQALNHCFAAMDWGMKKLSEVTGPLRTAQTICEQPVHTYM